MSDFMYKELERMRNERDILRVKVKNLKIARDHWHQRAMELQDLKEENARMRKALEKIARRSVGRNVMGESLFSDEAKIANAALKESK